MKKQISFSTQGQRVDIGDLTIYRVLPNRYADAVGTFVFLDHLVPAKHSSDKPTREDGTGPHPRRPMKICIPANTIDYPTASSQA